MALYRYLTRVIICNTLHTVLYIGEAVSFGESVPLQGFQPFPLPIPHLRVIQSCLEDSTRATNHYIPRREITPQYNRHHDGHCF